MDFPYKYVTKSGSIFEIISALERCPKVGLDLETTGLNTRHNAIRLLTLSNGEKTWVVDTWKAWAWRELFPTLQNKTLVGHNLLFDLQFLWHEGFEPGKVADTLLKSQLLSLGENHSHKLRVVAKRILGIEIDKAIDHAVWRELNIPRRGREYAAADTHYLLPLAKALDKELAKDGLIAVDRIEQRFLPFLVWISCNGIPFDWDNWLAALDFTQKDLKACISEMNDIAPSNPQLNLFTGINADWHWDNAKTLKTVLDLCEYPGGLNNPKYIEECITLDKPLVKSYRDVFLSLWDHPLSPLVRRWKKNKKRIQAYGLNWEDKIENGRIYPAWLQLKRTGRMGCTKPSVQQIPRDRIYRVAFQADAGYVLVKTDYCFTGDTLVDTPTGDIPIKKLKVGDYVYSYREGRPAVGEITQNICIGKANCLELTLDNGKTIKCTPEHKFMVISSKKGRNGYTEIITVKAKDLVIGNRLLPLKRTTGGGGYIHLYSHSAFQYSKAHVITAEAVLGPRPEGYDVHHKDGNKNNNNPSNLEYKSVATHRSEHSKDNYRLQNHTKRIKALRIGLKNRRSYKGTRNPNYGRKTGETVACLYCGTEFYKYPSQPKKFCSKSCAGYARNAGLNHKIVAIRELPKKEYVYSIAVTPDHNYALSAGVFVKNSQIELRFGAHFARERRMIRAYENNEDLHKLTASAVLGIPLHTVTDKQRTDGKIINFGFLYGLSPEGFRLYAKKLYDKDYTVEQAQDFRYRWYRLYPNIKRWHKKTSENEEREVRTITGRRRFVQPDKMTVKLNTPVQGSAADGAKRAGALMYERRHECPYAKPILINHDEIVSECEEAYAKEVQVWQEKAMLDAMIPLLRPIPVEVETTVNNNWAKPEKKQVIST